MREQEQFLQVLDRGEAERRFRAALDLTPRGVDRVPLDAALDRVLATDVNAPVDVPSFDRSNVDGFAVVAADTFGASEEAPRLVQLCDETIHTGVVPKSVVRPGTAVSIATGGMVPRGADAVVMVEHAEVRGRELRVARAVAAGSGISFAGTDITAGGDGTCHLQVLPVHVRVLDHHDRIRAARHHAARGDRHRGSAADDGGGHDARVDDFLAKAQLPRHFLGGAERIGGDQREAVDVGAIEGRHVHR